MLLVTEENIKWLKENGYHYVVMNRGKVPFDEDYSGMKVIKEDDLSIWRFTKRLVYLGEHCRERSKHNCW